MKTLSTGEMWKNCLCSRSMTITPLYLFSGLEIREFLKLYLKRYEVDVINYCSRIIFNHYQEPFDLNHKKAFFDKYSQISIDRLMTAVTMEEPGGNIK